VDKRVTSKLLEAESIEKIFQIDDHIGAATSGLVADARALIDRARVEAQINKVTYDEPIGVEVLSKKICDFKQSYTQYGGVRPFGTALLIAGVDDHRARLLKPTRAGHFLNIRPRASVQEGLRPWKYLKRNILMISNWRMRSFSGWMHFTAQLKAFQCFDY